MRVAGDHDMPILPGRSQGRKNKSKFGTSKAADGNLAIGGGERLWPCGIVQGEKTCMPAVAAGYFFKSRCRLASGFLDASDAEQFRKETDDLFHAWLDFLAVILSGKCASGPRFLRQGLRSRPGLAARTGKGGTAARITLE